VLQEPGDWIEIRMVQRYAHVGGSSDPCMRIVRHNSGYLENKKQPKEKRLTA